METKTLGIIAAIIVALAGAVVSGMAITQSADLSEGSKNELKAELFNFMRDTYVSQVDYDEDQDKMTDALAHPHTEFAGISTSINALKSDVLALRIDVARNIVEQPDGSTDFKLQTDNEHRLGELISITGKLPNKTTLRVTVTHESDSSYQQDFNASVFSDGAFTAPFAISAGNPLGTYTATFKAGGVFDSISFELVE
ncbi:hypothetical protein KAR91_03660 [Candidatus Pacearchaeota archaeon]|nr:hypothetical protein [Candidatus Pacearchaeota archaeon]